MTHEAGGHDLLLKTDRLVLRPWKVEEAATQRGLWLERDPRVPPHRRIGADGHPTVAEFEVAIRAHQLLPVQLLAVDSRLYEAVVGYCGFTDSGRGPQEPELAFEFFRRFWGSGYATEASWAVLAWGRSVGFKRVWASVWDWNTASRRVLAKLEFTEHDREEGPRGINLITTRPI